MWQIALYLAIGLGIGMVSGVLGIGGGVLMIPVLIFFCDFTFAQARGTSLAVLVMPVVLPAAWKYYLAYRAHPTDSLNLPAAVCIAISFAVGGYIGAELVTKEYLPKKELELCFGIVMLFVAMRFIIMTDDKVAIAASGLAATVVALIGYAVLRALGRRHLTPPSLGKKIQEMAAQDQNGPDYYI